MIEHPIPYSPDAEQAVVGGLLVEPSMLPAIAQIVSASDFLASDLQLVFGAIVALAADDKPIDKVALCEYLRERNRLADIGGPERLSGLLDTVPTVESCLHYAQVVREKADVRSFLRLGKDIATRAIDGGNPGDLMQLAERGLDAIRERQSYTDVKTVEEAARAFLLVAIERATMGMPFGIRQLDITTRGMKPGQLVIVAARPGVGKSAFMEQTAIRVAKNYRVLYIPTEMGRMDTVERIMARTASVAKHEVAYLSADRLDGIMWDLKGCKLDIIDNNRPISVELLWALCAARKPNLLIIDHARHIRGWLGKGGDRDQAPTMITAELTRLAATLDCCVLLAHQINREGAKRDRPTLADLRDTGALEEMAHKVVMLHRPCKGDEANDTIMEFLVRKNREGPETITYASWVGESMAIDEMTQDQVNDCFARFGPGARNAD